MFKRSVAALVLASLLAAPLGVGQASADNQMNYRLLPATEASTLPRAGGTLGLNVGPGEQINSGGLTFKLLKVNSAKQGSPGAQAGFRTGDQIIAVDGRVFPSVPAFAGYVGSMQPGHQINVDYLPAGGGPQEAQRVTATLGGAGGGSVPAQPAEAAPSGGLSTGTKVAIGVGAAALFGCYKLGCFSRFNRKPAAAH
jgi:hypothetical protein